MKPKQAFIFLLGGLGLLLLGGGWLYYYVDGLLNRKSQGVSVLKAELEVIDERIANASQAQRDIEELSFITDIADDVLPPSKLQSDVVAELFKFANDSGIQLVSIAFDPTNTNNTSTPPDLSQTTPVNGVQGIRQLPASLVLSADNYDEILSFLQKLEENRRKIQVDSLGINPTDEGFNLNLVINFYVRG